MIPFEMRTIHNPDGTVSLKAVIAVEDANGNTMMEVEDIEKRFKSMITTINSIIRRIDSTRNIRSSPNLHWDLGKLVQDFIKSIKQRGFYCTNISRILAENTNKKDRYWSYKIRFVEYYPDKDKLDERMNYQMYQELLDVSDARKRKKLEDLAITDKVRSSAELRKLKYKKI